MEFAIYEQHMTDEGMSDVSKRLGKLLLEGTNKEIKEELELLKTHVFERHESEAIWSFIGYRVWHDENKRNSNYEWLKTGIFQRLVQLQGLSCLHCWSGLTLLEYTRSEGMLPYFVNLLLFENPSDKSSPDSGARNFSVFRTMMMQFNSTPRIYSPFVLALFALRGDVIQVSFQSYFELIHRMHDFEKSFKKGEPTDWRNKMAVESHTLKQMLLALQGDTNLFISDAKTSMTMSTFLASELFCQLVMVCDKYLCVVDISPTDEQGQKTKSFYKIAERLPMELQMKICNMVYNKNKETIAGVNIETYFRHLFSEYGAVAPPVEASKIALCWRWFQSKFFGA